MGGQVPVEQEVGKLLVLPCPYEGGNHKRKERWWGDEEAAPQAQGRGWSPFACRPMRRHAAAKEASGCAGRSKKAERGRRGGETSASRWSSRAQEYRVQSKIMCSTVSGAPPVQWGQARSPAGLAGRRRRRRPQGAA